MIDREPFDAARAVFKAKLQTELPIAPGAGACCRPDLKTPPAEQVRTGATFEAKYRSKCDHCEGYIEPGQRMGFDRDNNRVCVRHLP